MQEIVTCRAFSLEKAILRTEQMYFVHKKMFEVKILNDSMIISVKETSKVIGVALMV